MFRKLSIRTKVFSWIISLILLFLLLSFLFTAFLFKPYYILRDQKEMHETSELLASLVPLNNTELDTAIERAERMQGYMIEIISSEGGLLYPEEESSPQFPPGLHPEHLPPPGHQGINVLPPPPDFRWIRDELDKRSDSNFIYNDEYDDRLKSHILHIYYLMEDGGMIHLNHPVEPIEQSVIISTQFILFTGVIDLIVGILAAFLIARFFTTPVKELTSIARDMSRLDFSRKYESNNEDEIGDLGRSLNSLSDQLHNSLNELNSLNHSLQDEIERKRRIDEMRKGFIANVSHELRTPLSLIKGYAEGLQDNISEDRESREYYCSIIMDETQKMEKHVGSLLDLSQLQSQLIPLEIKEFDIAQLIVDTGKKYRKKFQENHIQFSFHHAGTLLVSADRDKTEQILVNYLDNAINHCEGERKIAVTLVRTESDLLRVKVSNQGVQIPEDSLEKIWDSYYKVDKARTRAYGGTGLGLSIVKAIQEQYGQNCGAENYSEGVIFWFDLTPV
ncbi:MAG: histidine kinase dimerization/phospho-acceptor domain-containing protein [Spirochaetales bacterium]|nr:histidine kinase dimerization/phospho-acceptor domain-containing protein [Spirochaetales bacterium]